MIPGELKPLYSQLSSFFNTLPAKCYKEEIMKLTARQALEIGLELWEWLEKTGGEWKYEWPGWEKYGRMLSDCPLCKYGGQNCSGCLVYWRSKPRLHNNCTRSDSPYGKWCNASTPRSTRFWAGRVAKLHREALEKLEG